MKRTLVLVACFIVFTHCRPNQEMLYEKNKNLKFARELDGTGDIVLTLAYLNHAKEASQKSSRVDAVLSSQHAVSAPRSTSHHSPKSKVEVPVLRSASDLSLESEVEALVLRSASDLSLESEVEALVLRSASDLSLESEVEALVLSEVEAYLRRIQERKMKAPFCIDDKKTDLAINQYPRIRHKHLFQLGLCNETLGENRKALQFYNLSAQAESKQPQLYVRRGLLRERLQDKTGAEEDFIKAVVLNPDYPPAVLHLALFQMRQGKTDQAIAIQKLETIRPVYAEILRDVIVRFPNYSIRDKKNKINQRGQP